MYQVKRAEINKEKDGKVVNPRGSEEAGYFPNDVNQNDFLNVELTRPGSYYISAVSTISAQTDVRFVATRLARRIDANLYEELGEGVITFNTIKSIGNAYVHANLYNQYIDSFDEGTEIVLQAVYFNGNDDGDERTLIYWSGSLIAYPIFV